MHANARGESHPSVVSGADLQHGSVPWRSPDASDRALEVAPEVTKPLTNRDLRQVEPLLNPTSHYPSNAHSDTKPGQVGPRIEMGVLSVSPGFRLSGGEFAGAVGCVTDDRGQAMCGDSMPFAAPVEGERQDVSAPVRRYGAGVRLSGGD